MSNDSTNPYAPPGDEPESPESQPWVFDPKNRVEVELHPPLFPRPIWKKLLQTVGGVGLGLLVGIIMPLCFFGGILLPASLLDTPWWAAPALASLLFFASFGGGITLMFLLLSWVDQWDRRQNRKLIEPLVPEDRDAVEWYRVKSHLVRRKWWLFRRVLRDDAVLIVEPEGLRIRGNRATIFIPRGAVEAVNLNRNARIPVMEFRKPCSQEYVRIVFQLVPEDFIWSPWAWRKLNKTFMERFEEFVP